MTDLTPQQMTLVRELTMTLLTFDGSGDEIRDHLTGVFTDPALSADDRDRMPEVILAAFASGTYILQQLRHRQGFEAVDAFLQLAAAQWALGPQRDATDPPA
ncbi:hypothetical protein C5C56_16105 [Rathayibacter sp. AY1D1]|uniref:hypothetical protein n=1 Tax=Rathayibacter sp. AY1D1 TaxID=2080542 RepID=UPI000CE79E24|nr:hypothetical protein [Rathayibacter sp. AY1D1]PPH95692.1 hypothetical protein C5C56_16105 [Rathayibacter sp. AY1D1]